MSASNQGEFAFIDWIRRQVPSVGTAQNHIITGIGDDCAVLRFTPGREVVVTTDMLMEGRHFLVSDTLSLERIGRKCLGVNLSDIAAMAAVPIAAVVAVALPHAHKTLDSTLIGRSLHNGMKPIAEDFDVALVGGDTNAWDGPLVVSVTVLGEATERGVVRRDGARVGDSIIVTGELGGSLFPGNQRHLSPTPRVREALALHREYNLHAMIDISDGLAADLGHILCESGNLGAVLRADRIPIHGDARALATRDGATPLDHALHDGEDFELCFTVSPKSAQRLRESPPNFVAVSEIGEVTSAPGLRLRDLNGHDTTIEPRGFDHLRD